MSRRLHVEKVGLMSEADALAKALEHEGQIEALEATVRGHERDVEECRRQIGEIRKLLDPIRAAIVKRFSS